MIERREFITLLGGTAVWPLAARAQQAGKTYRIGWLQPGPIPDPWVKGFRQGLQEFNYVEGKNLIIEYRWGDGSFDRLPAMAGELVGLNPDVILSSASPASTAPGQTTTPGAGGGCPPCALCRASVRGGAVGGERKLIILDASDVLDNALALGSPG